MCPAIARRATAGYPVKNAIRIILPRKISSIHPSSLQLAHSLIITVPEASTWYFRFAPLQIYLMASPRGISNTAIVIVGLSSSSTRSVLSLRMMSIPFFSGSNSTDFFLRHVASFHVAEFVQHDMPYLLHGELLQYPFRKSRFRKDWLSSITQSRSLTSGR